MKKKKPNPFLYIYYEENSENESPTVYNGNRKITNLVDQSRRSLVDNHPHREPEPLRGCPELRALRRESIFSLSVGTARLSASGSGTSSKHRLTRGTQPDTSSDQNTFQLQKKQQKKPQDKRIWSLTAPTHRFIQWLTGLLSCNIIICLCCQ